MHNDEFPTNSHGVMLVDTAIGYNVYMTGMTTASKQRTREVLPSLVLDTLTSSESLGVSYEAPKSAADFLPYHNAWSQIPVYTTAYEDSPQSTLSDQTLWDLEVIRPCLQDLPQDATCDTGIQDATGDAGMSGHSDCHWSQMPAEEASISWSFPDGTSFGTTCFSTFDNSEYLTGGTQNELNTRSAKYPIFDNNDQVLDPNLASPTTAVDTPSSPAFNVRPFTFYFPRTAKVSPPPSDHVPPSFGGFNEYDPHTSLSCSTDIKQEYHISLPPAQYSPDTQPDGRQQKLRAVGSPAITRASRMRRAKSVGYLCPYSSCGSTFTALHNLKNHVNSHKGIKPHVCRKCGRRFGTRHVLTRHNKKLCRN